MPHIALAAKAIINQPMLVNPDSAINAWHKIAIAVLAEPLLKRRRNSDFILHCNPSCSLYIFAGQFAVFLEYLFCMLEEKLYALFCYFLLLDWLFVMFLCHFSFNKKRMNT